MLHKIKSWLVDLEHEIIQHKIPAELSGKFKEYRAINNIGRIQIVAWIYTILAFNSHLSGYKGVNILEILTPDFSSLEDLRSFMVFLNFPVALYITFRKSWIIQNRRRQRGVFWVMAIISVTYLLFSTIDFNRTNGSFWYFMLYLISVSWMFSLFPKELFYFLLFSDVGMIVSKTAILDSQYFEQGWNFNHFWMNDYNTIILLSLVVYIFGIYNYYQNVTGFLNRLQIQEEQKRIQQLEEFKSRFYTNLTHEFRTPLTIIIGMSKEITANPVRWAKEGAVTIRHHASNLLQLVNQILNLSKIESGTLAVHMINGNIIPFLGYIIDSFSVPAHVKNITIHYLCQENEIIMDFDPDKFKIIVGNLISNAIKFSPEGSHIYVTLQQRKSGENDQIEISVQDQGIGIAKEETEHIFERFYQVKNEYSISGLGTGVGLSLVRELVDLFHGEIKVVSTPGKGTQFIMLLPITQTASRTDNAAEIINNTLKEDISLLPEITFHKSENKNGNTPEILVIEDNTDVSRYLEICLQDDYQLSFCKNGEEGISLAIQNVPDLILSDVMMPVKDGIEVVRELKRNPVTSHIPVILLTAKADVAARITGLESGVDAYMTKPFDKDELKAQIQNLLLRYKEFHARYAHPEIVLPPSSDVSLEVEDEFITRTRTLVNQHLDDTDFSVHHLERGLFLSRSQLHKKLKALTGLSAMQYVSRIRLSIAREKLQTEMNSIGDIAYTVGYSDPNYFSKVYSEEYGESPSETRTKHKKSIL